MARQRIDRAMILAAGFGTRMAPLTDTTPKPLVKLAGQALIDWTMDRLGQAGVKNFVINTHYLAEQMQDHFKDRADVTLRYEPVIQETGGGVRDALPVLGDNPFFVTSSDVVWFDGISPAANRMLAAWDGRRMDALLLLVPVVNTYGYDGPGDYYLTPEGELSHRAQRVAAPYVFAGLQILKPSLFADVQRDGPFPLRDIYLKTEAAGRLAAIVHDGEWFHVGTAATLSEVEEVITEGYTRANTR